MNEASQPSARLITVIAVFLTFAAGASDVAAFTRLGGVFTSVMTGNMTVFGLSVARGSVSLAVHTAVAFGGYVTGVATGTRIDWHHSRRAAAGPAEGNWPPHVTLALCCELALLAGVLAGWELTGARPAGTAQYVVLAMAACAMGIQSATVNQLGLGNVSTTYLTGTLTGLVSSIVRPDSGAGARRPGVLAGLVAGATLAGVLLAAAPRFVPLLPLLGVVAAVVLGSGRPRPPSAPDGGTGEG